MATLGIDVGGTYARAAVVDERGNKLASSKSALADRTVEGVVQAVVSAAREAMAQAPGTLVDACGVGAAAQLQGDSGVVSVAPNLGWRNVPFGALLERGLGRRVRVVNDLSAAAWGEFKAGAGRGADELFVVFVGSGVGSAIITQGRLVAGATGVAGEFGHIKVEPGGRNCGCGERGCLEAYAGGHNLVKQMGEALRAGKGARLAELSGNDPECLTPLFLEEAAQAGDPGALEIYERAVGHLSLAIANQVTVLNPARLILGGGVLRRCPEMRRRIREGIERYAAAVSKRGLSVVEATLGDDSGLVGAALLATP